MVLGTFVAMLFRFWAMQRWVFTRVEEAGAGSPASVGVLGSEGQ